MYADADRWAVADRIERLRKFAGAKKKPAVAGIEVNKQVHTVVVGDKRNDISCKVRSTNERLEERLVAHNTLDTAASYSRIILRVKQVKPSGVLVLQGQDGRTWNDHQKNCAPCHLPNLDLTVVTADWRPPPDFPCKVCLRIDDAAQMLMCDHCNSGYHMFCLRPPLSLVPDGIWSCPVCSPSSS